MQHIPDKEFDQLFKDKFTAAEIEPSAQLWDRIAPALAPKRKKILPIYWLAAATVALVFTATLLFNKPTKILLRGADPIAVSKTAPLPIEEAVVPPIVSDEEVELVKVQRSSISRKVDLAAAEKPIAITATEKLPTMQPTEAIVRLAIKQQEVKPIDISPLTETVAENPIVIAQVTPTETLADDEENSTKRKGIRNVGDLVNYVVDKVDKRERKLLKFNTDDDDNSSLIGINIGFLKLNSKRNK